MRNEIYGYVREKYHTEPEYLWLRFPGYAVLRRSDNRKWYGIIMNIRKSRLGLDGDEQVDVLNLKIDDPLFLDMLLSQKGYFPGYHSSKGKWISVILDGTVSMGELCPLIDMSFAAAGAKKRNKTAAPRSGKKAGENGV